MPAQTKWRALIAACGLLVTVLASRVFYFQELFFAFLFFAVAYLILVLLVGLALGLLASGSSMRAQSSILRSM